MKNEKPNRLLLARHYDFTLDELHFIIKYRMGKALFVEDGAEDE